MRKRLFFFLLAALLWVACDAQSPALVGDVTFHDEFVPGQTGNWLVEGDDSARAAVVGEQLLIEVNAPQLVHYATLEGPEFDDFSLEVDVTRLGGDLEGTSGLFFRMLSPDQFYRYEITASGMFLIERRNADGTWTRFLDDWQDSPAIKTGHHVVNRLKVVAVGSDLSFFVNDELVLQASDGSYASGKIALDAGTFGRSGVQVVFDNVIVRQP